MPLAKTADGTPCFVPTYPMHAEVFLRQPKEGEDPSLPSGHLHGRISAITFEGDGGEKYTLRLGTGDELLVGRHEIDSDAT